MGPELCRNICFKVLLAVSFAWGPVLLDVMQSLVLLLHVCPFDTGDRIVFRGASVRKCSHKYASLYYPIFVNIQ